MNERVIKLEAKLDTMLPTLATKGDVSEAKADIIKWLAGIAFAIVAIIISVLAFMLNCVAPPQSTQQTAPIIIYPQQAPVTQQTSPSVLQSPLGSIGSKTNVKP